MGWVGDRVNQVARRVAVTAADLPLTNAIAIHGPELRHLVGLGVSLGRIAEALEQAGVKGGKTGKPVAGRLIGRMLRAAPEVPPIQPPPDLSTAVKLRPAVAPPPEEQPRLITASTSRRGRGLESLAGRKPKQ